MLKYHLTESGVPKICEATKVKCKYSDTQPHYNSAQEAQEAFERKQGGSFSGRSNHKRAKNAQVLFHGTNAEFDSFDNSFTGKGNDAYGSGFYFSDDEKTSMGYGTILKKVEVSIDNPLVVDGRDGGLSSLEINQNQVVKILQGHPDIYLSPKQADESEIFNPIGDYSEEYWDKQEWSKAEIDRMIQKVAKEYFNTPGNFAYLSNFYGEDHATAFRESAREATGWDGVKINFDSENVTHWVAWFPEQVRIID